MKQRRLSILLLALMGLLAMPSVAGPPGVTIVLVPSATSVPSGGSVDIDVVISGLGNLAAPSLGTFDLDLQFDPALFSFNSIAFGLELGDPLAEAITGSMAVGGNLNAFEVSLLTPATLNGAQPASFTLFTVTLDAGAPGTATFDAVVNALGDENGAPLPVAGIVPVTVQVAALTEIPTLGPLGVLLLSVLLLAAGITFLRRIG